MVTSACSFSPFEAASSACFFKYSWFCFAKVSVQVETLPIFGGNGFLFEYIVLVTNLPHLLSQTNVFQLDTNDHLHLGCLWTPLPSVVFSLFNKISSIAATKRAPVNSASGIISTAPTFTKLCAFSFDDHS